MQASKEFSRRIDSKPTGSLHIYPERGRHLRESGPASSWGLAANLPASVHKKKLGCEWFVNRVNQNSLELKKLPKSKVIWRLLSLRKALRAEGTTPDLSSQAFALIRELSGRTLGQYHYDCQILAAWAMLNGLVAEMETGEGKTLAVSLAAATAALAGTPVHVLTVNDYLANRDAEALLPLFNILGLDVGVVTAGMSADQRKAAYACDLTYCTAKELAFDYLRDRMVFGSEVSDITRHIDRLYGQHSRSTRLLLRGLHFAIIDECDSILIDEASTPLVLAGTAKTSSSDSDFLNALRLAKSLQEQVHFVQTPKDRTIELTSSGVLQIKRQLESPTHSQAYLRETQSKVIQALCALHLFHKDHHYLIRDNRVQIIDENTGRVKPDHSWERGLQQMIELKEGCKTSAAKKVLARMSYQRLFRRYLQLSGTTGTASQVKSELNSVYGLGVMRIAPHRPIKREYLQERIFLNEQEKIDAIVERARSVHKSGRPVLLATRTLEASESLSLRLHEEGLEHQLLSARQDENEAMIVAKAGTLGCITVATNMAGRGTDIALENEVLELGGLYVIATERHEASRIDHQLFGRCARQGNPGSCELFTSSKDHLVNLYCAPWLVTLTKSRLFGKLKLSKSSARLVSRYSQWRSERYYAQIRRDILQSESTLEQGMGFSGSPE